MSALFTRLFFQPISGQDIGMFRTLFCGTVLIGHVLFLPFHLSFYSASIDADIKLFLINFFPDMQYALVLTLALTITAGLTLTIFGAFTRPALIVATASFFIFYKPVIDILTLHHAQLPFLILLILSVTPHIGAFSFFRQNKPSTEGITVNSWPLVLPLLLLGISYFGAGYWKIIDGGLPQFTGEVLQYYLAYYGFIRGIDISLFLSGLPLWILAILSTGVIIFQISFLLIFIFPTLEKLYIPIGILFHISIIVLFHISDFPLFYASAYFASLRYQTTKQVFQKLRSLYNKLHN